jgi:hypothetical protein
MDRGKEGLGIREGERGKEREGRKGERDQRRERYYWWEESREVGMEGGKKWNQGEGSME